MKFPKLLLILAVLGLSTLGLSAQTKKLSTKEFDSQIDAAFDATKKKVRRITVTDTLSERDKEPATIYEYIPPDRYRWRYGKLAEYIEADGRCYITGKDGGWKVFSCGGDMIPPYLWWTVYKGGEGNSVKLSLLRQDVLNGQIVQKYSREARRTFTYDKGETPPPPVVSLDDVWVDTDGLILRAETIFYDHITGNVLSKVVKVWEYDSKDLKIEAPIK